MKLKIDESWKLWWQSGMRFRFRVTSTSVETDKSDGSSLAINHLYRSNENFNPHANPLDPAIAQWLFNSVPWNDWDYDMPKYTNDFDMGIRFKHRKHVLLFKMAWHG